MVTIPDPAGFVEKYKDLYERMETTTMDLIRADFRGLLAMMRSTWARWNGGDMAELDEVARCAELPSAADSHSV